MPSVLNDDDGVEDFSGGFQKREPRAGRRAMPVEGETPAEELISSPVKDKEKNRPAAAKKGGWGDSTPKEKDTKGPNVAKFTMDDEEACTSDNNKKNDSDEDMPVIPDLETQDEEDMTTVIAAPPSMKVGRVQTIRELDNDLQKFSGFYSVMDEDDRALNLKLLTQVLVPQAQAEEEDKTWVWGRIFTEVSSALQDEWMVQNQNENEDEDTSKVKKTKSAAAAGRRAQIDTPTHQGSPKSHDSNSKI